MKFGGHEVKSILGELEPYLLSVGIALRILTNHGGYEGDVRKWDTL